MTTSLPWTNHGGWGLRLGESVDVAFISPCRTSGVVKSTPDCRRIARPETLWSQRGAVPSRAASPCRTDSIHSPSGRSESGPGSGLGSGTFRAIPVELLQNSSEVCRRACRLLWLQRADEGLDGIRVLGERGGEGLTPAVARDAASFSPSLFLDLALSSC